MVKSATKTVTVGKIATSLTIEVVECGGPPIPPQVAGYLKETATGNPISGQAVELWINDVFYDSYVTLGDGSYGFYKVPIGEGTFTFETIFGGDATYAGSEAARTCTYAKVSTSLSISVSPPSGTPPLTVAISGRLTRVDTGAGLSRLINLYKDGVLIESQRSSMEPARLGEYSFSDALMEAGTYSYYVDWAGDEWFSGCGEEPKSKATPCRSCEDRERREEAEEPTWEGVAPWSEATQWP